jgi:hypothetical protein
VLTDGQADEFAGRGFLLVPQAVPGLNSVAILLSHRAG